MMFQRTLLPTLLLLSSGLSLGLSVPIAQAHVQTKAQAEKLCTFMPENSLHLQDTMQADNGMTEELFNKLIDEAVAVYGPIIETYKAKLSMERNWSDGTVNAYAQQYGSVWEVAMFGGLARREEVTPDGFQLVICHEIGHHVGGYPLKGTRWASTEGQSDYFATQACARALWAGQKDINAKFRETTPEAARTACDAQWSKTEDQNLCYRAAMGGLSLAKLLGALGGSKPVDFATPDTKRVTRTNDNHPAAQCRLDTYFNGALCSAKTWDSLVIPGKNNAAGQGSPEAEQDSDKYVCGGIASSAPGVRPGCWFKSVVHK